MQAQAAGANSNKQRQDLLQAIHSDWASLIRWDFKCFSPRLQALFKLSVEFRKEETRFLNKVEQQKGLEQGSTLGFIEDEANK